MSELNQKTSVGQWVARCPQTAREFEKLRIDYCCRGNVSLEEACRARRLDPLEVITKLLEVIEQDEATVGVDWTKSPLSRLCDHIEQTHHAFLKTELPRLSVLIDKVLDAHIANHPELSDLRQVFGQLRDELEPHMFKEEKILFPAVRRLEQETAPPEFSFGTVANPIRMMEHEHDVAGQALEKIRELTSDFHVPDDACNSYRVLLEDLRRLEEDLHQHIHKENNILFPRALQLENCLAKA